MSEKKKSVDLTIETKTSTNAYRGFSGSIHIDTTNELIYKQLVVAIDTIYQGTLDTVAIPNPEGEKF